MAQLQRPVQQEIGILGQLDVYHHRALVDDCPADCLAQHLLADPATNPVDQLRLALQPLVGDYPVSQVPGQVHEPLVLSLGWVQGRLVVGEERAGLVLEQPAPVLGVLEVLDPQTQLGHPAPLTVTQAGRNAALCPVTINRAIAQSASVVDVLDGTGKMTLQ
jgi:hypothetical protein